MRVEEIQNFLTERSACGAPNLILVILNYVVIFLHEGEKFLTLYALPVFIFLPTIPKVVSVGRAPFFPKNKAALRFSTNKL